MKASQRGWPATGREYDDIPGTIVFDGPRCRRGYPLNKFLMSLNTPENRARFGECPDDYLRGFPLSPAQRLAVDARDWLGMLEEGGNIYYIFKLAAFDGMTFQQLAAVQSGMTEEQYLEMMLAGGRRVDVPATAEAPGERG